MHCRMSTWLQTSAGGVSRGAVVGQAMGLLRTHLCLASANTTRSTAGRSTPSPSTRQLVTMAMLPFDGSAGSGVLAARRTGSSTCALAGAFIRPLTRPRATPCAASELRATRSSSAARALLLQKQKAVRTPCRRWQSSIAALSSASSRDATPPPPASPRATRLDAGCGASPYSSTSFVRSRKTSLSGATIRRATASEYASRYTTRPNRASSSIEPTATSSPSLSRFAPKRRGVACEGEGRL